MYCKRTAFTLIELLVVIAIVGILAALSIAVYDEYKGRAYDSMAKVAQHDVRLAAEGWINTEWDGTDVGYVTWWHRGDGTDAYGSGGSAITDFYSAAIDNETTWYIAINTPCMSGSSCANTLLFQANAGHCKSKSPNGDTYINYHVWQNYNTYTNETVMTNITKASRQCP